MLSLCVYYDLYGTNTSEIFREKQKVTFLLDLNYFYNGAQSKYGKVVVYGDSFAARKFHNYLIRMISGSFGSRQVVTPYIQSYLA